MVVTTSRLPPPFFVVFFLSRVGIFVFWLFSHIKFCFKPRRTLNGSQETLLGSFLSSPISRAPPAPCSPGLPPPCSPLYIITSSRPVRRNFEAWVFQRVLSRNCPRTDMNWGLHTEYTLQHGGGQYKSYYFVEKSKSYKISPLNAFPLKFRVQDNFYALRGFLASARFQLIV